MAIKALNLYIPGRGNTFILHVYIFTFSLTVEGSIDVFLNFILLIAKQWEELDQPFTLSSKAV